MNTDYFVLSTLIVLTLCTQHLQSQEWPGSDTRRIEQARLEHIPHADQGNGFNVHCLCFLGFGCFCRSGSGKTT